MISAHKNGPSIVKNGRLQGENLIQVWQAHPELFGKKDASKAFPLLVKLLDANDNLSVQVHPNDTYARMVEGEWYGKMECWYVIDCEPGAEIIYGHNAKSADEFKKMVEAGNWDHLLNYVKVKKGDFFFVPSGTIHAIGKGIAILEIQQSSDITYRIYDYDRRDSNGNKRQLHLNKAIEVMNFASNEKVPQRVEKQVGDLKQTQLVKQAYFTVFHWKLNGKVNTPSLEADYLLVNVIAGNGEIRVAGQTFPIQKGTSFILPACVTQYEIKGNTEFIVAHE